MHKKEHHGKEMSCKGMKEPKGMKKEHHKEKHKKEHHKKEHHKK